MVDVATYEKDPEPYETDTDLPVLTPVDPAENLVPAPTQVLEEPLFIQVSTR